MAAFDPFGSGAATAVAAPSSTANGFDPFSAGMAKPAPAPVFVPRNDVMRTDPDAHWRNLYGGLEGLDRRIDATQARSFIALDKVSQDPAEDRARAINQTFIGEKLGMFSGTMHSNWPAVKSQFAKSELGVDSADVSDKALYGWIGQRLNPPEPKGGDPGEIRAWTWRDTLSSDAHAISKSADSLLASISKTFKELPEAPHNLPDVWTFSTDPISGTMVATNPAVIGGVYNGAIKPLVESLESPLGIATLGTGSAINELRAVAPQAAKIAFKGVSGLFASLMGYGTYQSAAELRRLRADPNSTTQDQVAALSAIVSNGAMSVLGAFGTAFDHIPERAPKVAAAMEGKTVPEAAEILRREAVPATPEAADALNQAAAKLDELAAHAPSPSTASVTSEKLVGEEKIVAAAIKQPDGVVTEGTAHDAIRADLGVEENPPKATEGFVTNTGRFVDRTEASAIAQNADQLTPEAAAKPPKELHSHQVDYGEPRSTFGQTSLQNAYAELERDAYGFGDAAPTERRDMAQRWDRSAEVLKQNPEAGRILADRLLADPNIGLTDDQSALLLRHKVGLQNALNTAADALTDPTASPELKAEASRQVNDLSNQLVKLLDAVNRRGSEWGREGRWRQALAKEDYSFASQETLLRAAKGGAELTAAEREGLQSKIQALEDKRAELEAHVSRLTSESYTEAADRTIRAMQRPPAGAPRRVKLAESIREKLHTKADESRKALAGKVFSPGPDVIYHLTVIGADQIYSAGLDFAKWSAAMVGELGEKVRPLLAEVWEGSQKSFHLENRAGLVADLAGLSKEDRVKRLSGIAQELARSHIAQGLKDRDAVVDAVLADVKKGYPGASRREVMDAISGYGQFKPLSHDQITDQLRDLKGQMQQVSKLEDMAAGEAPKKTGMERRAVSDEERRLIQQVEEKKKEGGYAVTNPEAQLRTALQSTETRLENEIKDIEHQLKMNEVFDPTKKPSPTSPKIDALKAKLAELRDQREYARQSLQPDAMPRTAEERALAGVKTNLERQIKSMEKQIESRTKEVRERKGVVYDDEANQLKSRRDELREEFEAIFGKRELTDEQRLNIWKAAAQRRISELNERLAAREFDPPAKRPPPRMDEEGFRIKGELERIKQDFAIERMRAEDAAQPKIVRALKKTSDLARAGALSGYHTLAKLASYSVARFTEKPIVEAVGRAFAEIPGFKGIFRKANLESGSFVDGLAKFYGKAATDGMRDAYETLRTGKSTLKAELGNERLNVQPVHWYDYFGISHMAEKSPLLRGEFELRQSYALEAFHRDAISRGIDVTDPLVQGAIRKEAFDYAQHEILQENNQFSDWLNTLTARLESANPKTHKVDVTKQVLATFVKTFLTKGIVKTPANYVMQTLKRTPLGLAKGTAQTFVAHMQGIDKLTPEEANAIARLMKLGSVGTAVFVWGMIDASKSPKDRLFGGFYQPGDKRGKDDVGFGRIRVDGWEIPHLLSHNPLTESAQMGSTFYRVMTSKLHKKDKEDRGVIAAAATVLISLASESPIVSPITDTAKKIERGEADKVVDEELAGLIPMVSANLAQDIDRWKSRKAENLPQAMELNVPGLRSNVPETKAQKQRDIQQRIKQP